MTTLLSLPSITAAITQTAAPWFRIKDPKVRNLTVQGNFNAGTGSQSGTVDAYVQTSFDGGVTANDIVHFQFVATTKRVVFNLSDLTPLTGTGITGTDAGMAANSCQDGMLGDLFRVKYGSTGTYTGTATNAASLNIDVSSPSRLIVSPDK